jgi:2-iminobutanoate/2-iminopropanoate deaminase
MNKTDSKPVFGPYSPVRQAGDFYFVSGQIGVDPTTKTAPQDVAEQARQALTNLRAVLEGVGLSLDQVVKTTIFVTDISEFGLVNEVYVEFFQDPRPARSTVGVSELPNVADNPIKFEIEAIAMATRT